MDRKSFDIFILTANRENRLWSDCIFVFDTSALLAFYYYPDETRKNIFEEIFEAQKTKLWIPDHVQFEFLKNREGVIKKPIEENYTPLIQNFLNPITGTTKIIEDKLEQLKEITKKQDTHPFIDNTSIIEFENKIKGYHEAIILFDKAYKEQIENSKKEILQLQTDDTILEHFEKYFKVGRKYSFDEIIEITKEGKHRYEFKIPPGYKDLTDKKIGTQIFGDLIIWKQILEYAKEIEKNVVLVCNDIKEDWCIKDSKENNRIKSPRFELIKEFNDFTGKEIWMYSTSQFLFTAKEILKAEIKEESINDISELISAKTVNEFLSNYQLYTYEEKIKNISDFSLVEIGRVLKFVTVIDKSEANKIFISLYSHQIFISKIISSTIESIGNALSNFNTIDPILTENIYTEIPNNILLQKFKKANLPKLKSAIGELKSVHEGKTKEILAEFNLTEKYDLAKLNLKQITVIFNDVDINNSLLKLQEIPNEDFISKIKKERIDEIVAFLLKINSIDKFRAVEIYKQIDNNILKEKIAFATIDRIGQNLSSLCKIDKAKTNNILNSISLSTLLSKLEVCSFRDFCSVLIEIKPIDNNRISKKLYNTIKQENLSIKIAKASFKEFCNGIIKLSKIDASYTKTILNKIDVSYLTKKLDLEKPKFEELANAILNLNNIDKSVTKKIFSLSTINSKAKELGEDASASSEQSFLTSIFTFLELDSNLGLDIIKSTSKKYLTHVLMFDGLKKFKSKFDLLRSAFSKLNYTEELTILNNIK